MPAAPSLPARRREAEKYARGATPLAAGYGLSDALSGFRRTYPAVRVSAIEDTGDYLEHLLIGGEIDVGFLITSNLHNPNALQVESIAVSAMRLWLPRGHPLMAREATTPST